MTEALRLCITFNSHKKVLFINVLLLWLQGSLWLHVRLPPLSKQCAICNEMRWQQQRSLFMAAINWYSWSRQKFPHRALRGKIGMKSLVPQKETDHQITIYYHKERVAANILIFRCLHLARSTAWENDWNQRYADCHLEFIYQLSR